MSALFNGSKSSQRRRPKTLTSTSRNPSGSPSLAQDPDERRETVATAATS